MTDERFTYLARKYMDTVFRLAYSRLKSGADADDVTQNVLLKLYQSDKPFQSEEHIRSWLIRVTLNECGSFFRSPWRRAEPLEQFMGELTLPSQEHEELFRAVMALPSKYRVVIHLYYFEGYSSEELARLLDIPAATVRTRMARARKLMKKHLTEANAYD